LGNKKLIEIFNLRPAPSPRKAMPFAAVPVPLHLILGPRLLMATVEQRLQRIEKSG
jgi:hypothetical protein